MLDPFAVAAHELLDPGLQVGIAAVLLPRRRQDSRHRRVRVRMRCPQQRAVRSRRDGGGERLAGQEAVLDEPPDADRDGAAAEQRRVVRRRIVGGGLALRPELEPVKAEPRDEPEKGTAAERKGRSVADVVARIARKRQVVNGEQQPPDAQRLQPLEDELAQRIYSRCGASQIAPSRGSVTRAERGWLSHGTSSQATSPPLPTPAPPYWTASEFSSSA